MDVCSEVVPPEVTFDGVRVACHLYPRGQRRRPVTVADDRVGHGADAIGAGRADRASAVIGAVRERDSAPASTGLEVHFPIRGGLIDTLPAPTARRRPGRGRDRPDA